MTDTLFPLPHDPSPRLKWMSTHNIRVIDNGPDVQVECEGKEWRERRYCAHHASTCSPFHWNDAGFGDTELDAIYDFADKQGIKLWNEQA